MKRFIILLFLFSFIELCFSKEISIVKLGPGEVENYQDAISLSKETKNNIFIYFGAEWCGYCEKMKKNTFENKEVKYYINKNFIFLNLDIDKNKDIKEKFNTRILPECVIIDNNEEIIKRSSGYKSPDKFLNWLKN